jgi:hypothetical protein
LLIVVTAGDTAVGGGDFTVVVLFEFDSLNDLLVESVTIGCAIVFNEVITKSTAKSVFLNIFGSFRMFA